MKPLRPALRGFTLIEVLVVLTLVALLAWLAYPGYRHYVLRAQRAQARATLMEAAQYMERFRAVHLRYDRASDATPVQLPSALRASPPEGAPHHRVGLATVDDTRYLLHAVPLAADDPCGVLMLDQAGARGVTGARSVEDCWR
jgi:type IV pilus assembly protein PilE